MVCEKVQIESKGQPALEKLRAFQSWFSWAAAGLTGATDTHTHTHTFTCTCALTHFWLYRYLSSCAHAHMYTHASILTCVHTYMFMYINTGPTHKCPCTHASNILTCVRANTCLHTHKHAPGVHTQMFMFTYASVLTSLMST